MSMENKNINVEELCKDLDIEVRTYDTSLPGQLYLADRGILHYKEKISLENYKNQEKVTLKLTDEILISVSYKITTGKMIRVKVKPRSETKFNNIEEYIDKVRWCVISKILETDKNVKKEYYKKKCEELYDSKEYQERCKKEYEEKINNEYKEILDSPKICISSAYFDILESDDGSGIKELYTNTGDESNWVSAVLTTHLLLDLFEKFVKNYKINISKGSSVKEESVEFYRAIYPRTLSAARSSQVCLEKEDFEYLINPYKKQ